MKQNTNLTPQEIIDMLESFIKESKEDFDKTRLWKNLPKKITWKNYIEALDSLLNKNKIIITPERDIIYIWNPELAKRVANRKRY